MKKLLAVFSILACGILNSMAQPNGGFENWHTDFFYQVPDGWGTLNSLSITFPPNPLSAFKATGLDKHSGNYALKIKTIHVNNNPAPEIINDTIGLVFTGKIITSPPSTKYGFQYTGRPEKLEFWSKYIPVGSDQAGARVVLQKWNGTGHDTIAFGEVYISATTAYTLFQIDLIYFSNAIPDTCQIGFASSQGGVIPGDITARVGSILYVDDVIFTGWVGIEEQNIYAGKIKIFPNPASDNVTIIAQIEEADNIQIIDASGKRAGIYKIQNFSAKIDTGLFPEGIYFCEIRDSKNKILTKGKFNVVK